MPYRIEMLPAAAEHPITAGIGRFGPFVRHEKTYASLEAGDEVFDIGLNRAVTLIAEKIAKGPSGRRFGADPGKPLGEHPSLGSVAVRSAIERLAPRLVVCGHIHGSAGQWERLGDTPIVNAGPGGLLWDLDLSRPVPAS